MLLSHSATIFSGTVTENGNSQSTPVSTEYAQEAIFYLDITAASEDATLDITLNVYDSITDKWHLLATFSQKTEVSTDVGYVQYGLNDKVSCSYVVDGTFTFKLTTNMKDPR